MINIRTSSGNPIEKALRERAARGRAAMRPWGRSVEGAIRYFLPVIEEVKPVLTWNDIASVLAEAGIAWRNGRPVSGADLRSIVHRLRVKTKAEGKLTYSIGPEGRREGNFSTENDVLSSLGKTENKKTNASQELFDRARILKEMARSAAERYSPKALSGGSVVERESSSKI